LESLLFLFRFIAIIMMPQRLGLPRRMCRGAPHLPLRRLSLQHTAPHPFTFIELVVKAGRRETGEREIVLMRAGLIPYRARNAKIGYSTVNAKAETLATAPAFREASKYRRCLVPADRTTSARRSTPRRSSPLPSA
jgi:hypothetical protein